MEQTVAWNAVASRDNPLFTRQFSYQFEWFKSGMAADRFPHGATLRLQNVMIRAPQRAVASVPPLMMSFYVFVDYPGGGRCFCLCDNPAYLLYNVKQHFGLSPGQIQLVDTHGREYQCYREVPDGVLDLVVRPRPLTDFGQCYHHTWRTHNNRILHWYQKYIRRMFCED